MAKYSGSVKQQLSCVFCFGLLTAGLLVVILITIVVSLSVNDWVNQIQVNVAEERFNETTSRILSLSLLTTNQI